MIKQQVGEFERQILIAPGYHVLKSRRTASIASMYVRFSLAGPNGAVHWTITTDWFQASAREHLVQFPVRRDRQHRPEGRDIGYHSPVPRLEDHPSHECDLLPGGICYGDGSFLQAETLVEGFLINGDEWVWGRLEAYYRHTFEDAEYPDFTATAEPLK